MQLEYGAAPRAAGVAVALFAAGMIAARLGFGWWVPQKGLWTLLFVSAVCAVGVSSLFPLIDSLWFACVGLFFAGVSVACFWPTLQAYAVDRMSFDPTGVFILLSCGGLGGFATVSWTMGVLGDRYGLLTSFWVIPACLLGLTALLLFERSRAKA